MKGIIFNYLEEFVVNGFGEEAWEDLLDTTELITEGGAFVGPGSYPDEDLFALASRASEMTELPLETVLELFGEFILKNFSRDFPRFFEKGMTAKQFLQSIHCVIHVEVKKLHPDANTPDFFYEEEGQEDLTMRYHSHRKLCQLLRGLIKGVSKHFQEKIEVVETSCMHKGSDHCVFQLSFHAAATSG